MPQIISKTVQITSTVSPTFICIVFIDRIREEKKNLGIFKGKSIPTVKQVSQVLFMLTKEIYYPLALQF